MYQSECQADFMKRCEVGDLDGKHGLYDIGRTRKLFIDTNLNLYGVYYGNKVFYFRFEKIHCYTWGSETKDHVRMQSGQKI